ncbi:hypothetical protein MGYG_05204 [Nannizzia gypsea CBS 118893]|uniref:Mucin n=1 Tax=Arthroderma gypseum (strain ATCC MYA-4604 / CBS 118893) TaxID=535722 RepID=E4UV74_ARTGP|nr:hypothetical protein MGYG_05204 [Nannizzia gypsea CBS 118893]EFR02201.1 hypothetical protein MGYG_05204 [Nannizzia gypsea CBS 118893]
MDEQEFEVFDSLPPALRRKLFSNLERFRLEQMRLAQASNNLDRRASEHHHSSTAPSSSCCCCGTTTTASSSSPTKLCRHRRPSSPKARNQRGRPVAPINGKRRCKSSHQRVLQKPSAQLQTAYLTAQADSEWFQSLPPKVQQRHFSVEEQARLGGWRSSIIFDAADQACYKYGSFTTSAAAAESSLSLPATSTLSRSSSFSSMSSAVDGDAGVDAYNNRADDSLYDSFKWLDEEDDIDLSLDYHAHLAETSTPSNIHGKTKSPFRSRRPSSFRRTFSTSSSNRGMSSGGSALPSPRLRSQTQSHSNTNNTSNTHRPRSGSKHAPPPLLPSYLPHPSYGSVDHPAQFYQDPEARLKLRVYLASPQKFDEAIEFGFPSLEHNDNLGTPFSFDRKWKMQESPTSNCFIDSECIAPFDNFASGPPSPRTAIRPKTSGDLRPDTNCPSPWRNPSVCDSVNSRPSCSSRRPVIVGSSGPMGGREMTLKMTLTRPDLRSSELTASPKSSMEDPLKLADLPVDEKAPVWDKPEKTSMKSVWRKITGKSN